MAGLQSDPPYISMIEFCINNLGPARGAPALVGLGKTGQGDPNSPSSNRVIGRSIVAGYRFRGYPPYFVSHGLGSCRFTV